VLPELRHRLQPPEVQPPAATVPPAWRPEDLSQDGLPRDGSAHLRPLPTLQTALPAGAVPHLTTSSPIRASPSACSAPRSPAAVSPHGPAASRSPPPGCCGRPRLDRLTCGHAKPGTTLPPPSPSASGRRDHAFLHPALRQGLNCPLDLWPPPLLGPTPWAGPRPAGGRPTVSVPACWPRPCPCLVGRGLADAGVYDSPEPQPPPRPGELRVSSFIPAASPAPTVECLPTGPYRRQKKKKGIGPAPDQRPTGRSGPAVGRRRP